MLLSGHSLAVALSLLAAPILGRIYTPTEYGVVGIFAGVASVFSVVGNWQYSQAIIMEKTDHRAFSMFPVCVVATLFTVLLACIPTVFLLFLAEGSQLASETKLWFALIPIYAGGTALIASCTALANRFRHYRIMSLARLGAVMVGVTTSITFGMLGYGSHGLFMGLFADQLVMLTVYSIYTRSQLPIADGSCRFSVLRTIALLKRHRRFAIFSTPSSFIGNFSMQIPIYVLGLMGQAAWIGLFTRGRQLISMPVTLAAGSVAQVY
jgi:O-antigen/teichoic acid export membrane protein